MTQLHEHLPRVSSFWFGFSLPLRALKLIASKPKLIFWSLLPVLITFALYGVLISRSQDYASLALKQALSTWGFSPEGWLAHLLMILTEILIFLISALTFSFVATVTACPLNDFLAESVEPYTAPPLSAVTQRSIFGKIKLISIDVVKSSAAMAANLTALLFSWIPFVNIIALIATFLLVSFQFLSYPQTRRGQGLEEGITFLWKHCFACAGFGAAITLLFAIPFVSCLSLPLAVVGGTLLFARAQVKTPKSHRLK